ncbi:BRAP2 RING ZnF UBP domain-containing protein 2 [Dioscorea cayenensis subsp. rotundata]|uniref:BRAP2 RING ZnF UBP domain-containing protein 2 n=1 Tax=Dioscorea cayennensis subsp. rotundata TaxID=55577 RepID=A0AB40CUT1_DIOCR|nr:BRAP2 RING ZnF UBP domain-containing protein 2 [Dioscorea cayenensis subsp. rotundata]XP_039141814.1 BRAP2 RING ZnF UBP domain-containing protein 2 [Dioscorea cayenensis subsp. rotundata]
MSTSADGGAASSAASDDPFIAPPAPIPDDPTSPSAAGLTQAFPFSSGNPTIEETRGIMHLYHEDASSPSTLPVDRKPVVCVLAVPNHMTYADFCQFCGSFIMHMLEMRVVRNDGFEDHYCVLIWFDDQRLTDEFYCHFNGKPFSSLDDDICHIRFTVDVQYTGSIEHAQSSVSSSAEQPTCPVCLERFDQDTSGILTTICNHSFHCSCISKWTDSSCPVCRYCQQQPEKLVCSVCRIFEDLRMCVICGFVGCQRNNGGHAEEHWMETQHCYSLELQSRKVWDYAGKNYVHRLIQSKTDGKLVELNARCVADGTADRKTADMEFDEKIDAIHKEYQELLASQTMDQRKHYESLILEAKEENEKEIAEAIEKACSHKLQKMQLKLDKVNEEKMFLDDINENLRKNQEIWKSKILELEQREQAAMQLRDKRIQGLEAQLQDLMICIETPKPVIEVPSSTSSDIKAPAASCSGSKSPGGQAGRNQNT